MAGTTGFSTGFSSGFPSGFSSGLSSYNEQLGIWAIRTTQWKDHSECRDEMSSSGDKITTTDGEVYAYQWLVLMPKGTAKIEPGTDVRIDGRLSGKVIRFSSDQLHCRLWL